MRFVVLHTPGDNWQTGVNFREQLGIMEHVAHYGQLHAQGKLVLGGPFLVPDRGGMMVTTEDIAQEEIERWAASDPAVQSGLLKYEILPWHTPFEAE
jgi:uncharacterized protein YciI